MLKNILSFIKKVLSDSNNMSQSYEKPSGDLRKPIPKGEDQSTGGGTWTSINKPKQTTQNQNPIPYTIEASQRIATMQIKLQQFANGKRPLNWQPSRFLYKVGALRLAEATVNLQQIAQRPSYQNYRNQHDFRYSLIYALARCGDESILKTVDSLVVEHETATIKRLVLDAFLILATPAAKAKILSELKQYIPTNIAVIIAQATPSNEQLAQLFPTDIKSEMPPLHVLYLLSSERTAYRDFILQAVANLPLEFPYFQSLRYIYKSAELRDDFEILGILAQRLDSENASYQTRIRWRWDAAVRRYHKERVKEEKKAFSNRTKAYFQRRIIRNLRILGEQNQTEYCQYAATILSGYINENSQPQPERQDRWRYIERRWQRTTNNFITFRQLVLPFITQNIDNESVNKIPTDSKIRFQRDYFQQNEEKRTEPFAALWDKNPEYALQVLLNCQSDYVAQFALRILRQHEQLITRAVILQLVQSDIPTKAKFGVTQIAKILSNNTVESDIWTVLLHAPLSETRRFGVEQVEKQFDLYFSSKNFIEIATLAQWQDVGKWLRTNSNRIQISAKAKAEIFNILLEKVVTTTNENIAQNWYKTAVAIYPDQMSQTPVAVAQKLLRHDLENVQLLGGKILLFQKENIAQIPETLIAEMMTGKYATVRYQGLELFGAMPLELLLQKRNILVSLAIAKDPEIRKKVKPIIAKAAQGEPQWGVQLCTFFVPLLTQKETYEGLHTDTLDLLTEYLADSLNEIPDTQVFDLTSSRYREANLLGLHLLPSVDFAQAELCDIIELANHEMPAIRQQCYDYFQQNVGRVRYESTEAMRILDSKWAESRQFGFAFFAEHYKAGDWTPELLISVCDSTRPDVQEFSKTMLATFFQSEYGADYLLKLSQHPSVALQLFATNYLNEFAANDLARFIELKPYFKTVLCQLYKGGATKKAVFAFLKQEGEKDVITASHVIEILNEVSLTVAIGDKAKCIQVLHGLKKRFPQLDSVLEIV